MGEFESIFEWFVYAYGSWWGKALITWLIVVVILKGSNTHLIRQKTYVRRKEDRVLRETDTENIASIEQSLRIIANLLTVMLVIMVGYIVF